MAKISEKDRSQLLRMAGNIACGIITGLNDVRYEEVAEASARLALATLRKVDKLIQENNDED